MFPNPNPRILVVDDEPPIVDLLTYNLKRANYQVSIARDGIQALAVARRDLPDLVILDLMLPGMDGLDVCRQIRRERDIPIIMLTARDGEIDRVVGLELGADDYVVKPFSVRELMARVKNVLRRSNSPAQEPEKLVEAGPIVINLTCREAYLDTVLLDLTTLEFDLLHVLVAHASHVLSREKLLEMVWGYSYYGDLRAVDSAVKRLRAKLHQAAPQHDPIVTVRGIGYKLQA